MSLRAVAAGLLFFGLHACASPTAAPSRPAATQAIAPSVQSAHVEGTVTTATRTAALAESKESLVLVAGGDVSYPFGRVDDAEWESAGAGIFSDIANELTASDVRFANLEGPWTHRGKSDPGNHVLVSSPHRLPWLVDAGFNLFSTANNHSMDAGVAGLTDTRVALRKLSTDARPLWIAGSADTQEEAERPVIVHVPGKSTTLAVFAFAPSPFTRVDWGRSKTALARIAKAKSEGHVVVVSVHDGVEFTHVPTAKLAKRYRGYIDAGASVVLGHHPHVAQGIERYHGGAIYYSLGNLSFALGVDPMRTIGVIQYGLLAKVVLTTDGLREARAIPLYIGNMAPLMAGTESIPPRLGRPQRLRGPFLNDAEARFQSWSTEIPGAQSARVSIDGDELVVSE